MSPVLKRLCPACKAVLIASPATKCTGCARAAEQRRGSRQARGYDSRHTRWRRMVLASYPTCCDCGAPGQADDHADHMVALRAGGDWSVENGRRRCARCHGRKTVAEDGGFGRPRASQHPARGSYPRGGGKVQRTAAKVPSRGIGRTDVASAYVRHQEHTDA